MRFVTRGKLVLRDEPGARHLEVIAFFDSEDLASLAAAGMNQILHDQRAYPPPVPTPSERLVAGTDFRDGAAQTSMLPRLGHDGRPV